MSLHFFRWIAGKPSGPEADELDNSSIAEHMSASAKSTLDIEVGAERVGGKAFSAMGVLNTEEYWLASISAICFGEATRDLSLLQIRGPMPVLTLESDLA